MPGALYPFLKMGGSESGSGAGVIQTSPPMALARCRLHFKSWNFDWRMIVSRVEIDLLGALQATKKTK
ncbi:hypothetical protein SAMN04488109_4722 [Chryseolinea serpens]|uniref:Uncharacterized protein n=1 Tax=Chryseolinea serpens TaxID=947013 RepID=A0A1M5UIZ4_9BACT|nr:hypothetical protein SAMN04488109_4722 [Chryseolinea serpens]